MTIDYVLKLFLLALLVLQVVVLVNLLVDSFHRRKLEKEFYADLHRTNEEFMEKVRQLHYESLAQSEEEVESEQQSEEDTNSQ